MRAGNLVKHWSQKFLTCVLHARSDHTARTALSEAAQPFSLRRDDVTITTSSANFPSEARFHGDWHAQDNLKLLLLRAPLMVDDAYMTQARALSLFGVAIVNLRKCASGGQ
jgi:hypothetical protein